MYEMEEDKGGTGEKKDMGWKSAERGGGHDNRQKNNRSFLQFFNIGLYIPACSLNEGALAFHSSFLIGS